MPTLEDFNEELEGQVEPEQVELTFNSEETDVPPVDTDTTDETISEEASANDAVEDLPSADTEPAEEAINEDVSTDDNAVDDLPSADTDLAEEIIGEEASTGAHDPETGKA